MTRIASLFSGTGSLCHLVAAPLFDAEVAWCSDIDPAASKLLAHHWPAVPNLGDITAIDWTTVEPVDVITGGFPCQDISNTGKRAGIEGARSGLWSFYADAVRVLRPRYVLIENVGALVVRGLDRVLADLAALGFNAEWATVSASSVGAPHRRERLFIVARDADGAVGGEWREPASRQTQSWRPRAYVGGSGGASVADASRSPIGPQPEPVTRRRGTSVAGPGGQAPADTDGDGLPCVGRQRPVERHIDGRDGTDIAWGHYEPAIRRWESILGRPAPDPTVAGRRGGRQLNPRFVEWMQGHPDGHVCDVPDLTRNDQLKLLGNTVVPQQAVVAYRYLLPLLADGEVAA